VQTNRLIQTVEAHTEGLPVRVVTGGVGPLPGESMADRREWFIENSDDLRTFLMCEPRGHGWLSGAILQPPTRADADWGVLFIEVTGVLPMCGAGTIAVATVLVETGMVPVVEPVTTVRLDAPIGLITAEVVVRDGRAESVSIVNVPSYAHALDQSVEVPGRGSIDCDIGFGGNFYAFVSAADVGIPFERDRAEDFISAGREIMAAVNEQLDPVHPVTGFRGCEHVVFLTPPTEPGPDGEVPDARHVLINHPGWLDRSPGGTGTSALHGRPARPRAVGPEHGLRQRVLHRHLVHRTAGRGDESWRACGCGADDHRQRLADCDLAVHARSQRPVPRRLLALK
jgi:proline racemase